MIAPPRAQLADVDGHRLAWWSSGTGTPTVVLETGLGAESAEWQSVQSRIEGRFRVFRYDRSGRGASGPATAPQDAALMVDRLARLLRASGTPPPWLLVGHSFGGLLMRLFAHRYRAQVHGLVLVEAMHEDQFDVFSTAFSEPTETDPPVLTQMKTLWRGAWRDPNSTAERIDFPASFQEVRAVESLGNLPLRVLVAGSYQNSRLFPPERRNALQLEWERLQQTLLRMSSRATWVRLPLSEHFVQRDDPRAIVDAIDAVSRMR
ncbi:alpha/beta fold hydrolase [Paraburkholderia acidipaludis]|uniref:alpha/beta fold hydrolase n=1 Tax=Paraburkholderia acidipaludis TaxID=660537 RepID=UPI000694BB98|nr:alpha/beta hydrolase [Paraburkholderia acidipaludis]